MKKMNKILTTVLVIALAALTLAGCAKKDASPVTTDGSTSMEKVIGTLGEAFKEKEGIDVSTPARSPTGPKSAAMTQLLFSSVVKPVPAPATASSPSPAPRMPASTVRS